MWLGSLVNTFIKYVIKAVDKLPLMHDLILVHCTEHQDEEETSRECNCSSLSSPFFLACWTRTWRKTRNTFKITVDQYRFKNRGQFHYSTGCQLHAHIYQLLVILSM